MTNPTPYTQLGGDDKVRELVERFYDLMELEPEFNELRRVHPDDLGPAREKLYLYLSGWLGGPPLYTDKFGHPMLRARHLPYSIGTVERDQWLACMSRAMHELNVDERLQAQLVYSLERLATHMRNRQE
jgi:hemoglobin